MDELTIQRFNDLTKTERINQLAILGVGEFLVAVNPPQHSDITIKIKTRHCQL